MIEKFVSVVKKENTCGVKKNDCEKSIVIEADTCMTESSEIEQLSDLLVCLDCSVFAFLTSC